MTVIAIAAQPRELARLTVSLTDLGHRATVRVPSADELVEALTAPDAAPVDAVVVAASRRCLSARLIAHCDRSGTRLIALAAGTQGYRHAARLGLFEVLDAASGADEVDRMLRTPVFAASRPDPSAAPSGEPGSMAGRRGTVVTVWGPAGAPGRTSLAIALAAEFAAQGRAVALCDADTYGGSVATALGLLDEAPGFAAACRLAAGGGLTLEELDRVCAVHTGGRGKLRVLTGIGRPTRWPELTQERVGEVVELCRDWAEVTVIDTGFSLETDEEISSDVRAPRRNAATLAALQSADRIVEVGLADTLGLARLLRAHVDLREFLPQAEVTVAVNRVRSGAAGTSPHHQVRSTLARFGGIDSPLQIPEDQRAFDRALLGGMTLVDAAPRSAARLAVRRVAESLVPPPSETAHTSAAWSVLRRFGRMRGERDRAGVAAID